MKNISHNSINLEINKTERKKNTEINFRQNEHFG